MMTEEVKRGPGRPPKVRPEADDAEASTEAPAQRLIEVLLVRKYVPHYGQESDTEIKKSVPAGTVLVLPPKEATHVLKNGIARATEKTFDL